MALFLYSHPLCKSNVLGLNLLKKNNDKPSKYLMPLRDVMTTTPLRFITAASLFDGHDAAINIMRRLIQAKGAEVIHLGHNRSVQEIVDAAIQEDADAICVSSYQGGHMEYFRYLIDQLNTLGAKHICVFGGGGGTITPEEITALQDYGVTRIYHPNDGLKMGLTGIIDNVINTTQSKRTPIHPDFNHNLPHSHLQMARILSAIENAALNDQDQKHLEQLFQTQNKAPILGISGTGGAGKSSLTDELLLRFQQTLPDIKIALLAVDPTKRRTGGALLGDRIRMNSLKHGSFFMRSMATRRKNASTNTALSDIIRYLSHSGVDLVIVETAGTGQSDSDIIDHSDISCYVMTSEFGAASQLEKIDLLDLADCIVINKFEKQGSQDALRDVRKQWRRNQNDFSSEDDALPIYPCIASQFNDPGVNHFFHELLHKIHTTFPTFKKQNSKFSHSGFSIPDSKSIIPHDRNRYLSEIAQHGREYNQTIHLQSSVAKTAEHLYESLTLLNDSQLPKALKPYNETALNNGHELTALRKAYNEALNGLNQQSIDAINKWPLLKQSISKPQYEYQVRDNVIKGDNYTNSLSDLAISKVASPKLNQWPNIVAFMGKENIPGHFPFTSGVFPYRRDNEDPIRMFAGEGTPERTNRRFHYLSDGQNSIRLSTAFDSVTLYGEDPQNQPDVYGKVGNSGVSIATIDDMKKLFSGFDLCAENTSVSMTINGPAPIILAFFLNAAIDQQVELYLKREDRWAQAKTYIEKKFHGTKQPQYLEDLPKNNNGLGLALLGVNGEELVDQSTYESIKQSTLKKVRGTVQADILKEDQAQNTCIFSTEFSLRMMGDVQAFFTQNQISHFYSVSISGYHIAEAGANPITQLAFTLANGFTMVEYYLHRGMDIDDFAPNMSFFFSNGMDPEYAVIGRVARRIWAKAIKYLYKGNERSQKLKYHIQTSGRSLHAQEIQFNDIRTTLQAAYALFDNCNSLHTNAYDEAITTPTEESVRRAVAIQLIINKELGINQCENPLQGSYFIEQLTDSVEEAVYQEFDRLTQRGGVLGAMDTMYQRSKIQDESMSYENKKHTGSLPIVGVNTFLNDQSITHDQPQVLARSSDSEKQQQISTLHEFHSRNKKQSEQALINFQTVANSHSNTFSQLMTCVKHASLGQICKTLYQCGGEYRRNM